MREHGFVLCVLHAQHQPDPWRPRCAQGRLASTRPCVLILSLRRMQPRRIHVALSAVDAGACWHAARLLRYRAPAHAAKKLLALWFAPYGAPELLIVDQGGEFEGAFIAMCVAYSIDARVAGAHAPWQHGLAERHGGIFGKTVFNEMVAQLVLNKERA